ncbi:MAG: hypothetical protein N2999_08240, partial [Proteobacteria bacterium]|nr:hypothetical protein [Pseudomonadota bacterium]
YRLTDEKEYLNFSKELIELFSGAIKETPLAYNFFINSLSHFFDLPEKVSIHYRDKLAEKLTKTLKKLTVFDWTVKLKKDENIESEIIIDICSSNKCDRSFKKEEDFLREFEN